MIRFERRLIIRVIAETVGIDKECVWLILHNNFNVQNVCAEMVPEILTIEQNEGRRNVCTDTSNAIKNDQNFLKRKIYNHVTFI